ncbi:amino acid ABC transporter permease [Nocardioidaceae bacterium]|nr:amino acid ABC transporter permease [Nocardioidaceae bacterium]
MAVIEEFGPSIARGFWLTIQLAALSGFGSLLFGTLLAAMRVGPVPALSSFASWFVTLVRNTPLLVVCIIVFSGLPAIGLLNQTGFLVKAFVAVTVYTSPFVCEALRSGINSVPLGQAEAARAIGLGFRGTMSQVVLPQAYRASIPPMVSVLIAMTKNTSVVGLFGLAEAYARLQGLLNDNADQRIQIFLVISLGYVVIVELISAVGYLAERKVGTSR